MSRGQPDYGQSAPTEQYATLSDLAEVVKRLTDLIYADGKGSTVFHDDFEGVQLKWNSMTVNEGISKLDSTYAQSGSQSVKMDTAKTLVAHTGISREFAVPISQRLGAEISFCPVSTHTAFYMMLSFHESPVFYRAEARINFGTNKLYIRKADGSYLEVVTLNAFSLTTHAFHPFKLVADFDTKVYERVIVDGVTYDLASEPLYTSTTAAVHKILLEFEQHGIDVTGGQLWVDDAIFTQEEP
jgi:hypothetical protein